MAKILIVDDNPDSRELLRTLCTHRGHATREASDGAEALALARAEVPDLVIADVLMPTMDGYELVRRLRASPRTSSTPVIFYTAHYLTVEALALAERCGVRVVLTKPIEPPQLIEAVERELERGAAPPPRPDASRGEEVEREHVRLLTDELSRAVTELRASNEKLSGLVELSLSMSTERDPDRLLKEFCHAARKLVGARYSGAAAWNKPGERTVGRWCALGLSREDRASLRPPARPGDFEEHPPEHYRWSGESGRRPPWLPVRHPAVDSVLVAPILSMQRVYGWVYLADKVGLDAFTDEDESLVRTLAKQLGRIYENGKLYAEVERHASRLAERERQLSALFESAMDAMVISDDEGNYIEANPAAAELFGVERSELLKRTIWDFSESPGEARELWSRFVEAGRMMGEFRLVRTDGEIRELDFRATANFLPGRHLSVLRDMTENRRLEERLRHTAKMEAVGRLAGGIAHDFNNLLTVINGYTELALAALPADDPNASLLEEIKSAGERSAALTRQLLAFSRRQVLAPVVADLNEAVSGTERLLARIIGEDVRLSTSLARELGRCRVDPAQIEQILMNLAVNSRDAMPEGGRLTIETGNVDVDADSAELHGVEPGRYVLLVVADDGSGMDRETLARLFEPFFTTKAPGRGTGLGLATVYGIVRQSGGFINAYSEPGSGTTFRMYFPRVDEPLTPVKAPTFQARRGSETVLLVEDDDAVRRLTARILRKLGYTVHEAEGFTQAVSMLEKYEAELDLLLTDVVMPDGSSRALTERAQERHPEVRVVFMSGYSDTAVVDQGLINEGVSFLQKPFTSGSLSRVIREALDR